MIPRPNVIFTLPSLYDGTELECRLYFPELSTTASSKLCSGVTVLAHPYAPMGGSQDDHVIHLVGEILLKQLYLLITFDFRGKTEASGGKTSWSGKAELADFVSVYLFALAFVNTPGIDHVLKEISPESKAFCPRLLLGGYSYGSLMNMNLPDLQSTLELLQHATKEDSSDFAIADKARELAISFLGYYEVQQHRGRQQAKSPPVSAVIMGGSERCSQDRRRSSSAIRSSFHLDRVRRSMDRTRHKYDPDKRELPTNAQTSEGVTIDIKPSLAVLLVSPLFGVVSSLATMFSPPTFERRDGGETPAGGSNKIDLARLRTLVVYGTKDSFSSQRKTRHWCEKLKVAESSKFTYREVEGAGHFWHERQYAEQLSVAVSQWLENLA